MNRPLEECRKAFREHILPSFPQARRRFEERFKPSVELIRELPLATGKELVHNHPLYPDREARKLGLMIALLDADVALVALGLKPMALCQGPYRELMALMVRQIRPSMLFFFAGLELKRNGDAIEVFDPISLSLAGDDARGSRPSSRISGFYGSNVVPARYSHHELGYPGPLLAGKEAQKHEMELISGSRGYLDHPRQYYISHFGCKIYEMEPSASTLRARAAASALIEDIRRTPEEIESFALIRRREGLGSRIIRSVQIRRSEDQIGRWAITEYRADDAESAIAAQSTLARPPAR
jgi:hypothetical protein